MDDKLEEDVSDEEILKAIRNSMRDFNIGGARPKSTTQSRPTTASSITTTPKRSARPTTASPITTTPKRSGLAGVADMVHKDEQDYSGMSEEEQLKLAMSLSEVDALPPEEQINRAIQESLKQVEQVKEVQSVEVDDEDEELKQALALSQDPSEQVNEQYREHFQRLRSNSGPGSSSAASSAAPSVASASNHQIFDLEEYEKRESRPPEKKKKQPTTMASRVAASVQKQPEFFNEDLYEAQLREAINASLKDVKASGGESIAHRSMSLSPTPAASNGFRRAAAAGASMAPRPQLTYTTSSSAAARSYKRSRKGTFRPVVIDGCNVAFNYGRNEQFQARGLIICYEYFKAKGFKDDQIIIVVKHVPRLPDMDKLIIEELEKIGVLVSCPARLAGKESIRSDDDLFILETAYTKEGFVLSRDRYKQYWDCHPKYRPIIRDRLIQPTFVHDDLILPQDPLGRGGPTLDQFLRFDYD